VLVLERIVDPGTKRTGAGPATPKDDERPAHVVAPLADVDLLASTSIDLSLLRVRCPLGDELAARQANARRLLPAPTALSRYRCHAGRAHLGKEFGAGWGVAVDASRRRREDDGAIGKLLVVPPIGSAVKSLEPMVTATMRSTFWSTALGPAPGWQDAAGIAFVVLSLAALVSRTF
jgi:hypothetical protein